MHLPVGEYINSVVCPPRPEPLGSQTVSAQAAETAASMAFPPARRICEAASVAAGKAVADMFLLPALLVIFVAADKAGEYRLVAIPSTDR